MFVVFVAVHKCSWFSVIQVRCWEVQQSGTVIPKAQQTHTGPVLDVSWSDVSSHDFLLILLDYVIS